MDQVVVAVTDHPSKSGKKKCYTVKNVLLINAALTILFPSDTYAGNTHDKRIADATPYPLPAGSHLIRIKRCRIVRDTGRLRKVGVRDLGMEVCCALHNFRLRLTPWQLMVESR